jgi:hypothetical protein
MGIFLTVPKVRVAEAGMIVDTVACNADVAVGDAVALEGEIAVKALATSLSTMPAVGIVVEKPSATTCKINTEGFQDFSGLVAGDTYYVSETTAGAITNTPPSTPGSYQQTIGVAHTPTKLYVAIDYTLAKVT